VTSLAVHFRASNGGNVDWLRSIGGIQQVVAPRLVGTAPEWDKATERDVALQCELQVTDDPANSDQVEKQAT
jgi:hypothetical protein